MLELVLFQGEPLLKLGPEFVPPPMMLQVSKPINTDEDLWSANK